MELTIDKCIFQITDKVKQTRIGTHIPPLSFVAYPKDKKLCIISHLQEYLKRTTPFRKDSKQLLLSHVKPHGPVRKDTISRWCKSVLSSAGIDTSKFKGYSTRAASSSHLADNNINIKDIMLSAGWSKERTFQQFYHKPSDPEFNFGPSRDFKDIGAEIIDFHGFGVVVILSLPLVMCIHKSYMYFIFGIDKDIAGILVSLSLEFSSSVLHFFYNVEISKDFVAIGREFLHRSVLAQQFSCYLEINITGV